MDKAESTIKGATAQHWPLAQVIGIGLVAFIVPNIIVGLFLALKAQIDGIPADEMAQYLNDLLGNNAVYSLINAISIGVLTSGIVIAYTRSKNSSKQLGLGKTKVDDVLLAFPVYAVYFAVLFTVFFLIRVYLQDSSGFLDQDQNVGYQGTDLMAKISAFIGLVLIAPFYEELLFRGFIYNGLSKYIGFLRAAILTSLLFGLAHWQLNVGIDTFLLGLGACWLFWKTNSLWPSIFLHAIKNFLAFLLTFVLSV